MFIINKVKNLVSQKGNKNHAASIVDGPFIRKNSKTQKRLLILGSGSSGKSSFLKHIKHLFSKLDQEECLTYKDTVQFNVVHHTKIILTHIESTPSLKPGEIFGELETVRFSNKLFFSNNLLLLLLGCK